MVTWEDDRLDQLVREAAPAVKLGADEEISGLVRRLAVEVTGDRPAPRADGFLARWRRRLVVPVAVGVVGVVAAGGYAVWHDTDTAGFESAVERHTAELSLPPGTDRAAYVAQLREQGRAGDSSVSDLSVASMAGYYQVCAWLTAWDRRHAAGDSSGAADAVSGLRRSVEAPVLATTDGGGVVANLERVTMAAARGDRSPVARELAANCAGLPLDGIR